MKLYLSILECLLGSETPLSTLTKISTRMVTMTLKSILLWTAISSMILLFSGALKSFQYSVCALFSI